MRKFPVILLAILFGICPVDLLEIMHATRDISLTDRGIALDLLQDVASVKSPSKCLSVCIADLSCLSFSYNQNHLKCCLYHNRFSNTTQSKYQLGNVYYKVYLDECPQKVGFIYNKSLNLCWKPVQTKLTYQQAEDACLHQRARLIRIDNKEVWNHVKHVLDMFSWKLYYVQGSTDGINIYYDDGTRAAFVSWPEEEPVELFPESRFVIYQDDGYMWHQTESEAMNGYICQIYVRNK